MHESIKSIEISDKLITKPNKKNPDKPYMYYRARIYFHWDEELGIRPPVKELYHKQRREVQRMANAYVPPKVGIDRETLFIDYLASEFIPLEEKRTTGNYHLKKPITYKHFEARKHRLTKFIIEPKSAALKKCMIHKIKVGFLRPIHFEEFFKALVHEGISVNYFRLLRTDLSKALIEIHKRLPEPTASYFQGIQKPNTKKAPKKFFEPEILYALIQNESLNISARACVAWQLILLTRPSEQAAVYISDIDFERGVVAINKALRKVGPNEFKVLEDTKSGEASNRQLTIHPFLLDLLKRHIEAQGKKRNLGVNAFLFTDSNGHALTNFKWQGHWKWLKKELGLGEGPSFYSIKASGNSYYQALGQSKEALRFQMGHSTNSNMLITNYLIPVKSNDQRTQTILDEALQRASRGNLLSQGQNQGQSNQAGTA